MAEAPRFRAALFQMNGGIDPAANGAAIVAAAARAREGGADMLFTPEMSGLLDADGKRRAAHIRSEADDPVLADVRDAAARHGLWVQLGSLALRDAAGDDDRLVNRSFLIDASGGIRARYDKIHLFDADLPSGEHYRESDSYRSGDRVVVAQTPWGKLGLSICYDLRFADLYRRLTDAGAELLAVPAAFTVPTGRAHWQVLLRARAIEAGVFVVAAAQAGRHEDGRSTYGHSLAVDPWGDILVEMEDAPSLAFADIDMARVAEARGRVPALANRRRLGTPELAR
jgi:deaminated glutathione amidase